MSNVKKFSGKAEDYSAGRPAYADAFVDTLYAAQGFSAQSEIADIGCGTGIFARQLLERGSKVFGVEPNEDMRAAAEKSLTEFHNFRAVNGTAENTTLADNSVDFVTSAQAFHWFDVVAFKAECKRVLRAGGKAFLIWNMRDMTAPINRSCMEINAKFCPDFKGFNGGVKKDDERIAAFFNGNCRYEEFDNPLFYDREKFVCRCLSGSYALTEKDEKYGNYLQAFYRLFDENCEDGIVTVPNKTAAHYGNI